MSTTSSYQHSANRRVTQSSTSGTTGGAPGAYAPGQVPYTTTTSTVPYTDNRPADFYKDMDKETQKWIDESNERFRKWREDQERAATGAIQAGQSQDLNVLTCVNDPGQLQIRMDVRNFRPEEIKVRTIDDQLIVTALHEEKSCPHDSVRREATKKFILPNDVDPYAVTSDLGADGTLTIQAAKMRPRALPEREVQIRKKF